MAGSSAARPWQSSKGLYTADHSWRVHSPSFLGPVLQLLCVVPPDRTLHACARIKQTERVIQPPSMHGRRVLSCAIYAMQCGSTCTRWYWVWRAISLLCCVRTVVQAMHFCMHTCMHATCFVLSCAGSICCTKGPLTHGCCLHGLLQGCAAMSPLLLAVKNGISIEPRQDGQAEKATSNGSSRNATLIWP